VLSLVGGTAGILNWLRYNRTLGAPGVKLVAAEGSIKGTVILPESLSGFTSEDVPVDDSVIQALPKDTSFGQRRYMADDGFWTVVNVVTMGTDRTSMHKPQFCLEGQGWRIDNTVSRREWVPVEHPQPYELPVIKLVAQQDVTIEGKKMPLRGVYVYWFVADDALAADTSGLERMSRSALHLLKTGVLQRWSYISYFSVCHPGYEDATFERMKKVIAASVPEYQLTPKPGETAVAIRR
jgi:hypothetical protein